MPTITKRRNQDGTTSFIAQVRVAGFKATAKAFPKKADATTWATDLEEMLQAQRERGSVRPDVAKLTLGGLLLEFLKDPETTRLRYFDDLHRLCAWWIQHCGTERTLEFGVLQIRAARDKLSKGEAGKARGPATVNRYLSALRSAWNWARSAGLLPNENAFPARVLLTEPRGRTRFLDDDELAGLLKAVGERTDNLRAAIVLSIATGIRQGELLRLDWSDVNLEKQTLRIRVTKNDEPRTVHLPQTACDALKALQVSSKVRAIGGAVFITEDGARLKKSTLEARWKTMRDAIELKDMRWHDLRHSCASFMAQNGATLLEIGAQLGHKSPSVTQRYSHLVQGAALPSHAALDRKLRGGVS